MWTKILPLLFLASVADAQYTISTFAGGGPAVGQSVTTYGLFQPYAVAVDSAGNLYIPLLGWNQVWVVNSSGTLTQIVGNGACGFSGDNGPAASAQLCTPEGLAVDSSGNLYIADAGNDRIRKVSGGIITTVAGNGSLGFSGDGGSATCAELNGPFAVAVDNSGNLYIADTNNNRIRKVSGGIITTVAGNGIAGFGGDGGSATFAELNTPVGVAVDSSGNLYIADANNGRILKVSGGIITTVAGGGTSGLGDGGSATSAELAYPWGIAVDSSGNLYIADYGNSRVRKVSGGIITTVAGNGSLGFSGDGGSATSAEIYEPEGVAVDSSGNVYIADAESVRIRKVSGGIITTVLGTGLTLGGDGGAAASAELVHPSGSAVDSSGNVFIADTENCVVREVASGTGIISTVAGNGTCGFSGDGGSATSAELGDPYSIAADTSGNLYIADAGYSIVRKVSGGIITTVAGQPFQSGYSGDGGSATSAELYEPQGVVVDSTGNLYIADSFNNRIRKVSGGIITTVAGNGTYGFSGDGGSAIAADLSSPSGVAVDSTGNLYIADQGNDRIRKVSGGIITTVAGNGDFGFSGDGGSATSAELSEPHGVAVDSSGNLYIADYNNDRIRRVSGGVITTIAGDGAPGFAGDGGSATSAELYDVFGIAVDGSGNLYIADYDNNRIRKLTPNGTIAVTVTVSGAVQSGVLIIVTGSTTTSCTTSGGSCTLTLTPGGNYTLTPSLASYIFSPASTTLSNLSVSQRVSFTSAQIYTVTATVSGSVQNGVVISVTGMTLTSCTTAGSGSCTLALTGGGTYTLTPSFSGYNFFPASATLSNLSANQTANFTEAVMFTVSGTVSGAVQSGVAINVNGLTSTQTTTGSTGTYSIPLLPGGSYTISAALAGYTFTPAAYTFSNLTANQTANFTTAVDSPLDFYPVSPPCRIADTRAGAGFIGQFGPPTLAGGATRVFGILSSACAASIPSSVAAYSLNFTAIPPATGPAANLTTWPVGQPIPNASTLNYSSFVVANAAIVPAGTGGAIDVFVSYPADMLIDIDGYFAPPQSSGLEFFPVTSCRIADTRAGAGFTGQYGPPSLSAGATRQFYIPGNTCGIPITASAYSLNFAAIPPGGGSEANLTAWPGTQGMPNVSSLNFYSNVIAGAAIVPAASNGEMNVYVAAPTNLLIDTNGYFAPAQSSGYHFYPLPPCRIADTRSGAGFTGQFGPPAMATGQTRTFTLPQSSCEVPATAAAYSLNFTAIPPSAGQEANLTTWPAGTGMPNVSTLNYYGGVLANAAIVPAGTGGAINVYVADATDVVIDIDGYFAP